MTNNISEIRSCACSRCILCGMPGRQLYVGLVDRLFGAPGVWSLKQCTSEVCGLVWLDPMPLEQDIGLAYRQYYTHSEAGAQKNLNGHIFDRIQSILVWATGLAREKMLVESCYLDDLQPGRLLEIGCGSGAYLVRMRSAGWSVQGVEVDPKACHYAKAINSLNVHEGTIYDAAFPPEHFDAIVLNHVFEHVHDPVALLRECHRILKVGGRIVVITPNTESWGHAKFRANWRGLEPPRHLQIFAPNSLRRVAELANFGKVVVATTPANAGVILAGSLRLMEGESRQNGVFAKIVRYSRLIMYPLYEYKVWKKKPLVGEEAVLICQK